MVNSQNLHAIPAEFHYATAQTPSVLSLTLSTPTGARAIRQPGECETYSHRCTHICDCARARACACLRYRAVQIGSRAAYVYERARERERERTRYVRDRDLYTLLGARVYVRTESRGRVAAVVQCERGTNVFLLARKSE